MRMGQYNILSDAITVPSSMGRLLTTLIGMWILHIVAYPFHSHTFRLQDPYFQINTSKYLRHTALWSAKVAGWLWPSRSPGLSSTTIRKVVRAITQDMPRQIFWALLV
jgi:hypothetical protein